MSKHLVLIDTLSIKKYIFATRYLKEIRGASSLLDELNRIKVKEIIQTITNNNDAPVYANGGTGLFIIPSECVAEVEKQVCEEYHAICAGVIITSIPYDKDTFTFQHDFPVLVYKAEQKRYSTNIISKLSHPFFRDCNSNKKEYAVNNQGNETDKKDNEFSLLSVSSYKKARKNRDIKTALDKGTLQKDSLWYKINEKLTNGGYRDLKTLQFPDSFEDISENDPRQYIALIYADGNDMGHTVQQEIRGLEELGEFSTRIDEAIYTAASTSIIRHLHPEGLKQQKTLPFDILLIGGDDLVMVVPAIFALTVSLTIGQVFYETTGKSLCIGVAYAHDKYPIHSLLHITEDLLKAAKTERAARLLKNEKDEAKKGMINFLVIQQSGSLTWEDYKRDNLDYKEMTDNEEHCSTRLNPDCCFQRCSFERTCRPYTFKDVNILMGLSKDFKEKKFPLNKLHMLREAAFKSFYQSRITSRFIFTRSNKLQQELLYTLFQLPGVFAGNKKLHKGTSLFYRVNDGTDPCYKTALLDLIDIYSFLNSRDDEAEK